MQHSDANRRFDWISSVAGERRRIEELQRRMLFFYGDQSERKHYQEMVDNIDGLKLDDTSVRHLMPSYISELNPANCLEVGCGNGRVYRQLREYGWRGAYTGVELARHLIDENRRRHPEGRWEVATAYQLPFPDHGFDICFSLYVLEHLVFPERGLREMLRVLKPAGRLLLVFPDFVAAGRLSSQLLGFSPGRVRDKLKKGRWIDALVSLYDSRIRLPRALKNAVARHGPFPINIRPLCLSYPSVMAADVDAVYIASKAEVASWAAANGYRLHYPGGTCGELDQQAFMEIMK